jgi:RimJ/RimL family protein N-acetyltransferase
MVAVEQNRYGQPVGDVVANWHVPRHPERTLLEGRFVRVEPLEPSRHGADLLGALGLDGPLWTYLPVGPFAGRDAFAGWLERAATGQDPLAFALVGRAPQRALGLASYLRIDPDAGSIEVGGLAFGPALQRTAAATEAMALMMAHAFDDLGYRRYEWKCDALNAPSRRAALRLGFVFEGVFRQARVVKGRNRDTAWFSITDREWPRCRDALSAWLASENFDPAGHQRRTLADIRS